MIMACMHKMCSHLFNLKETKDSSPPPLFFKSKTILMEDLYKVVLRNIINSKGRNTGPVRAALCRPPKPLATCASSSTREESGQARQGTSWMLCLDPEFSYFSLTGALYFRARQLLEPSHEPRLPLLGTVPTTEDPPLTSIRTYSALGRHIRLWWRTE